MKWSNLHLVLLIVSILLISCKEGSVVTQEVSRKTTSTVSATLSIATIQFPTSTMTLTFIPTNTQTLTSTITPISAELGAMGISFDGEFYHGTMPDGGEFNAVMVENESGIGLVDKSNHFVAAAIDESGQWEQVGLYIGRMVTTAEAESAQTIDLEQVWDGSYARWCDLMFGVENRTTSKDLSNIVKNRLNHDIIDWVRYGDQGDIFEVKDVKSLGNGMWLFNVRAGIGNGFVESVNLMGPVDDRDSLAEMMGMRQGTFSMMILSRLEVDADAGELGNLGSLMQEIWNQQNELFGDSISQGLVNIEELEHGALKNVVIPVVDVHWPGKK